MTKSHESHAHRLPDKQRVLLGGEALRTICEISGKDARTVMAEALALRRMAMEVRHEDKQLVVYDQGTDQSQLVALDDKGGPIEPLE